MRLPLSFIIQLALKLGVVADAITQQPFLFTLTRYSPERPWEISARVLAYQALLTVSKRT
jgi:hypothetical protein